VIRLDTGQWPGLKVNMHDSLKKNESTLIQIDTRGPRGKMVKQSTSGVRRSRSQETQVTWVSCDLDL